MNYEKKIIEAKVKLAETSGIWGMSVGVGLFLAAVALFGFIGWAREKRDMDDLGGLGLTIVGLGLSLFGAILFCSSLYEYSTARLKVEAEAADYHFVGEIKE